MTLDYLAGLVDGEGCFQLIKGDKRNSPAFRRTKLTITMTTPAPLAAARSSFGGRLYGPYHYGDQSRQPFYIWALTTKAALGELLPNLIPKLLVKREKAEEVLAYIQAHPHHPGKRT